MKIVSWNVNGIRSIYKKGFSDYLSQCDADIVCLQETKAHPEQLSAEQINPTGFNSVFSSAEKKGYSGVATFAKDTIATDNSLHGISEPRFDDEGRFLITPLSIPRGPELLLYNIYFPSGSSGDERQAYKYEFLDAVLDHIAALSKQERKKLIILGDFNICHKEIDIHHPKQAAQRELSGFLPDERAWMDTFQKLGMIDSFRHIHGDVPDHYTWWTYRAGARRKNKGWRIDYIFIAEALLPYLKSAHIDAEQMGSDHCPLSITLQF